jgi:hypothetical protein
VEDDLRRKNFDLADIKRLLKIINAMKPIPSIDWSLGQLNQHSPEILQQIQVEDSIVLSPQQFSSLQGSSSQVMVVSNEYVAYNKVSNIILKLKANFSNVKT